MKWIGVTAYLFLLGQLFCSHAYAQSGAVSGAEQNIILEARIDCLCEKKLKLQYTIRNQGSVNVFYSTEATRVNGQRGPYLIWSKRENGLLEISNRVFPKPLVYPYVNKTSVAIALLRPNEESVGEIELEFPVSETEPPLDGALETQKTIASKLIKEITLSIGYFFEEEGILNVLDKAKGRTLVRGSRVLTVGQFKGKELHLAQHLAVWTSGATLVGQSECAK